MCASRPPPAPGQHGHSRLAPRYKQLREFLQPCGTAEAPTHTARRRVPGPTPHTPARRTRSQDEGGRLAAHRNVASSDSGRSQEGWDVKRADKHRRETRRVCTEASSEGRTHGGRPRGRGGGQLVSVGSRQHPPQARTQHHGRPRPPGTSQQTRVALAPALGCGAAVTAPRPWPGAQVGVRSGSGTRCPCASHTACHTHTDPPGHAATACPSGLPTRARHGSVHATHVAPADGSGSRSERPRQKCVKFQEENESGTRRGGLAWSKRHRAKQN